MHDEIKNIGCPICRKKEFELRNIGFVNCLWQYRGSLTRKKESKITGDGRTYDGKFYTFKEADYRTIWESLELLVKRLDATKTFVRKVSMSSDEEDDEPPTGKAKGVGGSPSNKGCIVV